MDIESTMQYAGMSRAEMDERPAERAKNKTVANRKRYEK